MKATTNTFLNNVSFPITAKERDKGILILARKIQHAVEGNATLPDDIHFATTYIKKHLWTLNTNAIVMSIQNFSFIALLDHVIERGWREDFNKSEGREFTPIIDAND